jgi:hypothetical protein
MPRKFPVTPQPAESEGGINYSVGIELNRFTGSTLVIGDTVFLSDDGVEVLASTDGSYYSVNAYSFIDSDNEEIGGMYGRDDSGQNVVGFRAVDIAENGDDTLVQIASTCESGATASASITANQDGVSGSASITLEQGDSTSEVDILADSDGRVRIGRKLNLLGASAELCNVYIKGTNFIIHYDNGALNKYFYKDLDGTAATWNYSTTEPT